MKFLSLPSFKQELVFLGNVSGNVLCQKYVLDGKTYPVRELPSREHFQDIFKSREAKMGRNFLEEALIAVSKIMV